MIAFICTHVVCAVNINLAEFLLWIAELVILHSFYRRIESETPDQYFSLYEIQNTNVVRFFFKYIGFRCIPIFLLCLLNYKILSGFSEAGQVNILLFNTILVFSELYFTNLEAFKKYFGYNLAWGHLFVSIALTFVPLFTDYILPEIETFLPSTQGVIDSVWSGLIIFALYSLILFIGKKQTGTINYPKRKDLLKRIQGHEDFIEKQCEIYNADIDLVKSIAIYEAAQRPKVLRMLESLFVAVFKKPTSQGIMQFTSDRILSDEESIILAIKNNFVDSATDSNDFEKLKPLVLKYNPSTQYANEIDRIFWEINQKFQLLQPQPLEEVGITFTLSGMIPVSWLIDYRGRVGNNLNFELIDIKGKTFMGGGMQIGLPDAQYIEDFNKIYFSYEFKFSPLNTAFIKASEGRITLKLEGQHEKNQFLYIPLIVPDLAPAAGASEETKEKHLRIGSIVEQYKKDLEVYHEELSKIYESRKSKDGDKDYKHLYGESAQAGFDIYKILEEDETSFNEYTYNEEDRLEKELNEKYKEAIEWRGPLAEGIVSRFEGFELRVYSDDHDQHFHVIHKGKGIDARFSFPELTLLNYKTSKTTISSKAEQKIRQYCLRPEVFSKFETEFQKRG